MGFFSKIKNIFNKEVEEDKKEINVENNVNEEQKEEVKEIEKYVCSNA